MGSHFVGKTTVVENLVSTLREKGHSVEHIPEIVRYCPFPINEETTFHAQFWILLEQIRREMELHKTDTILVTDRTVLDNFAYMYRRWKQGVVSDEQMETAKNLVRHWVKSYDHIFLLEPFEAPEIESDEFRSTDKQFRNEMHDIIVHLVEDMGVDVTILNGSSEEITKKILEKVRL